MSAEQDLRPMHERAFEPPFDDEHDDACPAKNDPDRACECEAIDEERQEEAHEMREDARKDRAERFQTDDGGLE